MMDNPGFFKIRTSQDITLYTPEEFLKSLENNFLNFKSQPFINGTRFKEMIQCFLPSNDIFSQKLDVKDTRTGLDIKHCLTGPSSEIVFTNQKVDEQTKKEVLSSFFEKVIYRLQHLNTEYLEMCNWLAEREDIIIQVLKAIESCDKSKEVASVLSADEAEDMITQVSIEIERFVSEIKENFEWQPAVSKFLATLKKVIRNEIKETDRLVFDANIDAWIKQLDETYAFRDLLTEEFSSSLHRVSELPVTNRVEILLDAIPIKWCSLIQSSSSKFNFQPVIQLITNLQIQINKNEVDEVKQNRVDQTVISVDNVPCFYCPFWPKIAKEWHERDRHWPDNQQIRNIVKTGCHIVSKSNLNFLDDYSWRWSFSIAETKLAQLRNPIQKYCYFLFKSFFYKYLKFKMNDRSLASYIAKTCMLFVCESHSEEWWGESTNTLKMTRFVIELFEFLAKALKKRYLPNYFIKESNILFSYPENLLARALVVVEEIIHFPKKYLKLEDLVIGKINTFYSDAWTNAAGMKKLKYDSRSIRFDLIKETIGLYAVAAIGYAIYLRSNLKIECCRIKEHIAFTERVASFQEESVKFLVEAGKDVRQLQSFLDSNLKMVLELKTKLNLKYEKALTILKNIVKIFKYGCHICDVCSSDISCGSTFYHCIYDCDYDECFSCFMKRNSNTVLTEIQATSKTQCNEENTKSNESETLLIHEHQLIEMNTCSQNCFSVPSLESFNDLELITIAQPYFEKATVALQKIGSANTKNIQRNLDDPGTIMTNIINEVFEEKYGAQKTEEAVKGIIYHLFIQVNQDKGKMEGIHFQFKQSKNIVLRKSFVSLNQLVSSITKIV